MYDLDQELTLQLLVAEESRNDAEALANILRNARQKSRLTFVADQDDLAAALERQAPDLVLCATGLEALPLEALLAALRERGLDVPVIAIGESADEPAVVEAMRAGADDLCSYDQPEHLQLVVQREVRQLRLRQDAQRYELKFRESEKRARTLMESSRDAIAYVHEGMHIFANHSYLKMFGFSELEEIEGTPILDMVAPANHDAFKDFLRNYDKDGETHGEFEARGLLPDGKQFDAVMEFTPASIDGEPCTQIIIRSQAANSAELEQKLKYLSKQDVLTGLYNRQYFLEELELAVTDAVSGSAPSGVIYLLMDNFKDVKDNHGIGAADMVISEIADLVREQATEDDIIARFGDHSFAILRRDCDADSIQDLARRLHQAVEEHIAEVDGQSITTTCSIGMSLVTESTPSAQEVIARADLACEVARSSGGNQIHMHNPVVDEQIGKERDQQMHALIKDALDNDQFRLVFQPIVSLQGDAEEKYEVLLRMLDHDGEQILPSQFLAVAQQTGQVADIDHWVIRHAAQVLAEHRKQGNDTHFFIKLSTGTLLDENLGAVVREAIEAAGLPGHALIFEIAEQSACQHLKQAKAFVKAVHELQCKTALEHFGSGPNSFQLLKHLPVDYLKVDGSFIHNLATEPDNQAMVKSILETARSMNKQCIAEFVQDAHSLAVLWQSGIDYIQGNFLQEPSESLDYDFSSEIA